VTVREAVIVDAVRTPVGRHRGALASVRPDDLAPVAIAGLLARTRFDPATVDDVILGCTNQAGEDSRNVARMALLLTGLRAADMDVIELNEAFAAQAIACMRDLDLDPAKVNVNGGAIALGHPLGSSGSRILTALVHEMGRRKARYGLATMCIGVGQGIATIVEFID